MRRHRWIPAAVAILVALGLTVPVAGPAAAEDLYVACSWGGTQTQDDRECGDQTFDFIGQVTRSSCWKYRPPSSTYVQMWVDGRWYRQTENVNVRIRKNVASCGYAYRWQAVMSVPAFADQAGSITYFRMVMPRTYQTKKTYFPLQVCTLPAYTEGWCQ